VIWVWDKAGIDFTQWYRWKQGSGIYVISCAKENLNLEVIGQRPWDRDDPVNQGVWADERVATSRHVAGRRVTYLDPESLQQRTQRSVKFIRWLRSHLFSPTPCSQALASLRASYSKL